MKLAIDEGFCMNSIITAMLRKYDSKENIWKKGDRKQSLQLKMNCKRSEVIKVQTKLWKYSAKNNKYY